MLHKIIFIIVIMLSSMNVGARQDYTEIRTKCSEENSEKTEFSNRLCERILVTELERDQCTETEAECDEQELIHLMAIYWATKMILAVE